MATKKPLVMTGGVVEQLQTGDTIDAPITTTPVNSVTNAGGASLAIGAPVYVSAADSVQAARANAIGTSKVVGLVYDTTISAAATGLIAVSGTLAATTGQWDAITGQTGGLTPGADYYLDAATAGKLSTTAPSAAGQFVVPVGRGISATEMLINPQQPIRL